MTRPIAKRLTNRRGVYRGEAFQDGKGEFRWRAYSENGNIIATSGEGYVRRDHAASMFAQLFPGVNLDWVS